MKRNAMPVVAIVGFATLIGTAIDWRVLPIVLVCGVLALAIAFTLARKRRQIAARTRRPVAQAAPQTPAAEYKPPVQAVPTVIPVPQQTRISTPFDVRPVEQALPVRPNLDRPQPAKSESARLTAVLRTKGMDVNAAVLYDGYNNPVTVRDIAAAMIPIIQKSGHNVDAVAARLPSIYFKLWDYAVPACEQHSTLDSVKEYIASQALGEAMKEQG